MSTLIELAEAVAASLADYGAEVQFVPEFRIRDTEDMKIMVVPAGAEFKALSRGICEEILEVHLGVLKKATQDDVPELASFVQALGKSFLHERVGNAICTGAVFDPVYSPSHLREKGLFASVIELEFRTAG